MKEDTGFYVTALFGYAPIRALTSIEHAATCSFLSEPSDTDCFSDIDGHSIFAKFNGTGIVLSHKRQYRRPGVVVREHRKFWLDPLKYPPSL